MSEMQSANGRQSSLQGSARLCGKQTEERSSPYVHNWCRKQSRTLLKTLLAHHGEESQVAHHRRAPHLHGHDGLLQNLYSSTNSPSVIHAEVRSCRQEKGSVSRGETRREIRPPETQPHYHYVCALPSVRPETHHRTICRLTAARQHISATGESVGSHGGGPGRPISPLCTETVVAREERATRGGTMGETLVTRTLYNK